MSIDKSITEYKDTANQMDDISHEEFMEFFNNLSKEVTLENNQEAFDWKAKYDELESKYFILEQKYTDLLYRSQLFISERY